MVDNICYLASYLGWETVTATHTYISILICFLELSYKPKNNIVYFAPADYEELLAEIECNEVLGQLDINDVWKHYLDHFNIILLTYVTGFEKSHLPRTIINL